MAKKFNRPEDLDQIHLDVPLNEARTLLSLCYASAEKAAVAIEAHKRGEVTMKPAQLAALEEYISSYAAFKDTITNAIRDNVSLEDQETIAEYERKRGEELKDELVKNLTNNILNNQCDDPDCDTCKAVAEAQSEYDALSDEEKAELDAEFKEAFEGRKAQSIRNPFKKSQEDLAREFDVDLPEGSFIVPTDDDTEN